MNAFGGNQFKPSQKRQLEIYFSIFYLSYNTGNAIGTIISPIFHTDVKCFDSDCYPLSFGVSTFFIVLSILSILIGTKYYKPEPKNKDGNIIIRTFGCVIHAALNKFRGINKNKTHWLECADDKYSPDLIFDVKLLLRLLLLFLPVPIFWALYEQQGSRWKSQAEQLNGRIGSWKIEPDQFQAMNQIFVILLVPLFDIFIYPFLAKYGLLKKLLSRMIIGYVFTMGSFLVAALLEFNIQAAFSQFNQNGRVHLVNLSPCSLELNNSTHLDFKMPYELPQSLFNEQVELIAKCNDIISSNLTFNFTSETVSNLVLITAQNNQVLINEHRYDMLDYKKGLSLVSFASLLPNSSQSYKPFLIKNNIEKEYSNFTNHFFEIDYDEYDFKVEYSNGIIYEGGRHLFDICGKYVFFMFENDGIFDTFFFTQVHSNGLHLGWQLIQIFLITIGEIMLSISGITFAYLQAPESMKSVLQALWMLTRSFGNVVVVIVAEARILQNQAFEYILFASLIFIATGLFVFFIYFFKFDENEKKKHKTLIENPQENEAFSLEI